MWQEETEGVGDTVQDQVAEEGGRHHRPPPASVRGRGQLQHRDDVLEAGGGGGVHEVGRLVAAEAGKIKGGERETVRVPNVERVML